MLIIVQDWSRDKGIQSRHSKTVQMLGFFLPVCPQTGLPERRQLLKRVFLILCAGIFLFATSADAREPGNWAIGGLVDYHLPTGALGGWYSGALKYGVNVSYVVSPRLTAEVEYHYSVFNDSNLPGRTFEYSDRQILSPAADSEMKWNSVSSNWLWFFKEDAETMSERKWSPYLGLGLGFYDYSHKVSGLIYPGNGIIPNELSGTSTGNVQVLLVYNGSSDLDARNMTEAQKNSIGTVVNGTVLLYGLVPTEDTRTAWTIPLSVGVEGAMGANFGIDLRLRYNLVFGEINPLTSWGLDKAFPIGTVDAGVSFKYYFE